MVSPTSTRNKKPAKAAARAASSRPGAGSIASEPRHMLSTMPLVPSAIPAHAGKGNAPPLPRQPLVYPWREQRKLNLGSSSDQLEAEAESTTDQVLRGVSVHPAQTGEPVVRRKCACEGSGAECTSCAEEKKEKLMRMAGGAVAPSEAPSIVHDVINLPGQPLDSGARAYFEPRFGRDFSGVRIHTDPLSAQSAQAVNALAYTVGKDIVFDRGHYAPQTAEGRRLLAHELTHVVQQGSGTVARRVQRDLVYGSDYKSPYKSDGPETRSAEAKTWFPATVDFATTASGSGGGAGAASFDDLISTIAAKGTGSITSLGIIGHATTDLISLSGTITVNPPNVSFTGAGVIDSAGIKSKMAAITPVRDRFAAGAKIILYGCDAGVGDYLMAALSKAFQVCVEGFSDEVLWCINWNPATRQINSRGRTWVDAAKMMASGRLTPTCLGTFNADIGKLTPDKKDCSGIAKASTPTPKATQSQGGTSTATPEAATQETAPTPMLQSKLAVNVPGDAFEQEADRIADQVMRMAVPGIQRKCSSCAEEDKLQRKCSECEEEEKQTELQRKESGTGPQFAPAIVHDVLRSPGQPLDAASRSFFEPRFGLDLGHIRVHTDARAAESSRAVNALAYAVGPDIVFSQDGYAPTVTASKALLAHELAHTIQQQGARPRSAMGNGSAGQNAVAAPRSEPVLQRSPGPESEDYMQGYKDGLSGAQANPGPRNAEAYEDYNKGYLKGQSEFQQKAPAAPGPATPTPAAPAAKQARSGTNSKGQDYVVYEKEIRVGGTRPWRNNNPGNFDKPGDHPTNIGNDGDTAGARIKKRSFLIFPDAATGKQELIDNIKAHGTSTIRSFITVHAPPSENDTEKYIREVVGFMNNGDAIGECQITKPARLVNDNTSLGSFSESERSNFAMAMAREEGWCDVTEKEGRCDVTKKKVIYNCQCASIPDEYKGKLACP